MKKIMLICLLIAVMVISVQANSQKISAKQKNKNAEKNTLEHHFQKRSLRRKSECQCGMRKPSFGIIGGSRTKEGEFPWQVAIEGPDGRHICGGSIINHRWILSAAHCPVPTGSTIIVGTSNLKRKRNQQVRNVETFIPHEAYDDNPMEPKNDILLIKVDADFEFNDYVTPICLPFNLEETFADEQAILSGWGRFLRLSRISSPILYKLYIDVLSNEDCQNMGDHPEVTDKQICAEGGNPNGACHGDSGGPIVNEIRPNQFTQIGVVSYGDPSCHKVAVYTRVSGYLDWIIENTEADDFCQPF